MVNGSSGLGGAVPKSAALTPIGTTCNLSRGTPNLENETWNASAQVIKGAESPADAAARLQEGLASWYEPQQ